MLASPYAFLLVMRECDSRFTHPPRSIDSARRIFGAYPLAPLGVIGALSLVFLGYWKQIRRFHLYALLTLAAVFGAPELGIEPPHYTAGLGIIILAIGVALLTRFLSTYPRADRRDDHAGSE